MIGRQALGALALLTGIVGGSSVVRTVVLNQRPRAVAIDTRASRAFVATLGAPGHVSIIDMRTGTVLRTVAVGQDPTGLAVDAQAGRVFVSNTGDTPSTVTVSVCWPTCNRMFTSVV